MEHFDCWASRFGETVTALELAPEGTGYRARTRFAKFFNLPELMNLFKEVADIKTADQLDLPTPKVEYHTEVCHPTEQQKAMVQALSKRAAKVHSGSVDAHIDNMLRITSDGRKLGLDQRILNPMLPDDPGSKVNQCARNVLRIWREGEAGKLTQLVFCDISTPGNGGFNVYDDLRAKLIAGGMPQEQIAFIHEANTDARKKELFAKVRSGQVRVLMGSTQKMGAGTNVQDRLIALHDLDCPWRPRDLTQRKGRIERQGNTNDIVHVYRYVTEGTFDAYLWQTVEKKQQFISQIMTSKSPVRSCEDVDETALSFAEIKALCAGDPRIKERMELDVDVTKLKIMKADYQNKRFRMEDNLAKHYPERLAAYRAHVQNLQADITVVEQHPHPADDFISMQVGEWIYHDKESAGEAILEQLPEVKGMDPVEIGTYRGFTTSLRLNGFHHEILLRGAATHVVELGKDARGNLTRIDNVLTRLPQTLKDTQDEIDNLLRQCEAAKAELAKPFLHEEELRQKSDRLIFLDSQLKIGGKADTAA